MAVLLEIIAAEFADRSKDLWMAARSNMVEIFKATVFLFNQRNELSLVFWLHLPSRLLAVAPNESAWEARVIPDLLSARICTEYNQSCTYASGTSGKASATREATTEFRAGLGVE